MKTDFEVKEYKFNEDTLKKLIQNTSIGQLYI